MLHARVPTHTVCSPPLNQTVAAALQQAAAGEASAGPPPPPCAGITGGVCTLPCQRTVCDALASFLRIAYNESLPWTDITGWELTRTVGCGKLITAAAAARPAYCSWPGVQCCTPTAAAARRCSVVHAVANLSLGVNSVNASCSDPEWLDTLEQLHSCGMVELDLEANELSGEVSPRFGRLTNLTILNLGRSALRGGVSPSVGMLGNGGSAALRTAAMTVKCGCFFRPCSLCCSRLWWLGLESCALVGNHPGSKL